MPDLSTPLLYVLRNDVGLNGPRFGCGLGQCGACIVHMNGRATFSCILPIAAVWGPRGHELEGLLENGKPNKLQQAFIDEEAAQCGYCISGMVMRAQALCNQNQIRQKGNPQHMRSNLCRCGTHTAICARSDAPPSPNVREEAMKFALKLSRRDFSKERALWLSPFHLRLL